MGEKLENKIILKVFLVLLVGVFIAALFSVILEKQDIKGVAQDRLMVTARVITKSLEDSMVEANADFTRQLVADLKTVSGYDLLVFNHEGREAFDYAAPKSDDATVALVVGSGEETVVGRDDYLYAYLPLVNLKSCQQCHASDVPVIGVVRMAISLKDVYGRVTTFAWVIGLASVGGAAIIGVLLWWILRRTVIAPVQSLERAARRMSEGDLSFTTIVEGDDEIGNLDRSIKDALYAISNIIRRVKNISSKISSASVDVERKSDKVVKGTIVESEAVSEISSSVEELNAAISEIAESTQVMNQSIQDTAASIEEMTVTINSISDITHEVSEGVDTTTASLQEFSASIKEVVEHANELSRVSDETLSAVEEITTSIKQVEGSAKESAGLSRRVAEDASTLGMAAINKSVEGMESIRTSVKRTAEVVQQLEGRSEEIGSILNVIDDITDQTTLLALNAAILAAQAGEHGKGFSVVANEIKDLAERTALSTQEIGKLIADVRGEVRDAVHAMDEGMTSVDEGVSQAKEAATTLRKILDSSRKSAEMSASIERATAEQASSARYVIEAIDRVRHMVEQIVRATSEQSKGVSHIMEAAERIRDASHQAEHATEQQASGSKQIAQSVDQISEISQQITRAIREQKVGSKQIWLSAEKIKSIPDENRDLAFAINKSLRELMRDSDLARMEIERFSLYEESDTNNMVSFGVVPFEAPATLYARFQPLMDYLSTAMGRRFDLQISSHFDEAMAQMKGGELDFCFMTSVTYIDAHREAAAEAVARIMRNGKPVHRSVIFVRDDSTVTQVEDLKGRSMAFVDQHSASGFIIPRVLLRQAGIELENLAYHNFLGYHEDVVEAVLKGDFDGGAVMEDSFDASSVRGLRAVAYSDEVPQFSIVASREAEPAVRRQLYDALMALTKSRPDHARVLEAISSTTTGFSPATDSDFDSVRRLLSSGGARNA
jgi:phosphate/phosphite/phosphonate ABC transporter binding protein